MVNGKNIVVIGYSGHAYVVLETAKLLNYQVVGYFDSLQSEANPFDLKYLGDVLAMDFNELRELTAIVTIGDNKIRRKLVKALNNKMRFCQVIHPTAYIGTSVVTEEGVFINANVTVNAFAKIGKHVILNTACIVEHECEIGDYVHIAPGAVLAGAVKVGEGTFVGANSTIKQGVNIGKNVIIGAGSVIIKDVPDHCKVVGNPMRFIN